MIAELVKNAEQKMQKCLDVLVHDLSTIRTGRANPSLVDRITIDYHGTPTPLNQMASISAPEARLLVVQPWDRSAMSVIEKTIRDSDLGLNPGNDGQVIRVPIPPLTEDRRRDYVKLVRQRSEEARISIRNVRRGEDKAIKDLEKEREASEDEAKRGLDQVQKATDRFIERVNELERQKEAEVMEV
ncbi:MAG: ribosome recycling factor [Candidatus Dormibacteria bacterium]